VSSPSDTVAAHNNIVAPARETISADATDGRTPDMENKRDGTLKAKELAATPVEKDSECETMEGTSAIDKQKPAKL